MKDDEIRYQDALPKAPDSFMRRMRDEIERMDEQMVRRHKMATMLVVALMCAALIAGAAIAAANSDLLRNLFPNGAPPEAAQLLVTDNLSDEKDGLKLTVNEHLYDGRNFHLTWTVESTRDDAVYVATEYQMLDAAGEPIEISSWSNRQSSMDQSGKVLKALNVPLGGVVTPKSYEGFTSNGFLTDEAPTEPWTYTLDIYAYSTKLEPVTLEGYTDDLTDEQLLAMENAGQLGIEMKESLVSLYRYSAYQAALDESDWRRWSSRAKARVAANERCGLLTPLTHLSVTLNMDPEAASVVKSKVLPEPITLKFNDLTVKLDELGFDLTGAHATYEVPAAAVEHEYPQLHNLFLILDQDGRLLNRVLSEGSCGVFPMEGENGEPMMIVEQGGGVPESVPQSVRLIRGPAELQALLEQCDFDEALRLWQKDGSDWEEMRVELE